jgi:hypothetical protein
LAAEQHRREADAVAAEGAAHFVPIGFGDDEVAAIEDQGAHFLDHAAARFGLTGAEDGDHGLRVLAEQAEDPAFQALIHREAPARRRMAQAAKGATAAMAVTGP